MSSTVINSFSTLRDTHRAALGCPSILSMIMGSWLRPFASDSREHGTQPTV